jgi:hypothetical protein
MAATPATNRLLGDRDCKLTQITDAKKISPRKQLTRTHEALGAEEYTPVMVIKADSEFTRPSAGLVKCDSSNDDPNTTRSRAFWNKMASKGSRGTKLPVLRRAAVARTITLAATIDSRTSGDPVFDAMSLRRSVVLGRVHSPADRRRSAEPAARTVLVGTVECRYSIQRAPESRLAIAKTQAASIRRK